MRALFSSIALALGVAAGPALADLCDGFADVDSNASYCSAVAYLKDKGVTLGCTDTAYCPDAFVTRAQMALFLQRMGRGGPNNTLPDATSTIGGGDLQTIDFAETYSTIGGGFGNHVQGAFATVSGGHSNVASGANSTIPGGSSNFVTGAGGLAAGTQAAAHFDGQFIWADATAVSFHPGVGYGWGGDGTNTFNVRAVGGAWFVTAVNDSGVPTAGSYLNPGSGTWSQTSDRALKDDVQSIEAADILNKVAGMPLTSWRYTSERGNVRHLGPMAQDFYAAFGLGPDDKSITTIDEGGVALAAIQGLNTKLEARDVIIAEQARQLAELRNRMDSLDRAEVH